jgi:hypothetical protein
VEGVVTLDGKPLTGAIILLQRADGPIEARAFAGETDTSGHYAIKSANSDAVGALPGEYSIRISSVKVPADANELTPLPKERVPAKWLSGRETLTVPEGGTTEANFAMTSR